MGFLDSLDLPTLNGIPARAIPKGPSRLDVKMKDAVDEKKAEQDWRKAVWKRDKNRCRHCEKNVLKTLELLPLRGEVHHVKGREDRAVRWDVRNGLLLCHGCHERVTGTVNDKFLLIGTKFFILNTVTYIDANKRVRFKKVA